MMPGDSNWSTRLDSILKMQAEEILSEVGLTMSGVFTMLLKQIVREKSVPLSLSLDSSNAVYADLLEAQYSPSAPPVRLVISLPQLTSHLSVQCLCPP